MHLAHVTCVTESRIIVLRGSNRVPDLVKEMNLNCLVSLEHHVVVIDQEWLAFFREVESCWFEGIPDLLE